MTGYIIRVKTSKLKNYHYITTETLVDNIVYSSLAKAFLRISQIRDNKVSKHNFKISRDDIIRERNKGRFHSEMKLVIVRDNYKIIKTYTIKSIKIL